MTYTYLLNITSLEHLKALYCEQAMKHHPDVDGGNTEAMQAINNEYDQLFPIWKARTTPTTEAESKETADSYRSEFYTQNGWKGENYKSGLSLKQIATLTRDFMKNNYPDFRFSVRTSYASMCQELHVDMTECPVEPYKTPDEWTEDERTEASRLRGRWEYEGEKPEVIEKWLAQKFLVPRVAEAKSAVDAFVDSYNYDDSDAMIDYHDVNFYYFDCNIGRYDKPCKVVPREVPKATGYEWETYTEEVEETKTRNTTRELPKPAQLEKGQCVKVLRGFNYGRRAGFVYRIYEINDRGWIKFAKLDRRLQKECHGNATENSFTFFGADDFWGWYNKGSFAFVEITQENYTEKVTRQRRRKVFKGGAAVSTEVREPTEAKKAAQAQQATSGAAAGNPYTVSAEEHTKTGAPLWVLRFENRMSREEYEQVRDVLDTIKGRWNKFKKGFVFYYDATEAVAALFGGEPAAGKPDEPKPPKEEPPTDAERNLADWLEYVSFEAIEKNDLRNTEYFHSLKYRTHVANTIKPRRDEITPRVLALLEFAQLQEVYEIILAKLDEDTGEEAPAA